MNSVSDKKVYANRRNSRKSTGPDNTSCTRLNAVKHGLLAAGITELDNQEGYRDTLRRLGGDYLNEVQEFLLARLALYMVRLQRTARLEAEFITSVLHPAIYGNSPLDVLLTEGLSSADRPLLDPGLPPSLDSKAIEALVTSYQRYESSNESKFYRAPRRGVDCETTGGRTVHDLRSPRQKSFMELSCSARASAGRGCWPRRKRC